MITSAKLLILCGTLASAVIGTWALILCIPQTAPPLEASAYTALSVSERVEYWHSRIAQVGGTHAYSELAETIEAYTPNYQHDEAHLFGDALYRTQSVAGVSVCDGRFGYACFHAFMIRALLEQGALQAQQFYDICERSLGTSSPECEHGIGHGLLALKKGDVTLTELQDALSVCSHLEPPPTNLVSGCVGGVFMEYLVKSMASGDIEPRVLTADNTTDPCTSLRESIYIPSCMYWLPLWWMLASPERNLDEAMAARMGAWCMEAPSPDSLTACIKGVANRIQLLTDEQPALTEKICHIVTKDAALRYTCHTHAARRFTYYFSLQDSLIACSGLPRKEEAACRIQATEESRQIRSDREKHRTVPNSGHVI